MAASKTLALIVAGYALAVVGGLLAVTLNEMAISEDIQQTSGGMVAFGDVVLFVFVSGVLGLIPTWFLLRLWVRNSPSTLIKTEFIVAVLGPASWLAMWAVAFAGPAPAALPIAQMWVGPLIAFVAVPRIVAGPIVIAVEAATIFLVDEPLTRRLLGLAIIGDIIPIAAFALHMGVAMAR
jgi:hypothetical protein